MRVFRSEERLVAYLSLRSPLGRTNSLLPSLPLPPHAYRVACYLPELVIQAGLGSQVSLPVRLPSSASGSTGSRWIPRDQRKADELIAPKTSASAREHAHTSLQPSSCVCLRTKASRNIQIATERTILSI